MSIISNGSFGFYPNMTDAIESKVTLFKPSLVAHAFTILRGNGSKVAGQRALMS
jgi:hypothetical protein